MSHMQHQAPSLGRMGTLGHDVLVIFALALRWDEAWATI